MKRNQLGRLLRDMREESSLTQKELAKKLGTSQRRISYWETGRSLPTIYEFKNISDYFSFTMEAFIEYSMKEE